jgi:hypothetical protein
MRVSVFCGVCVYLRVCAWGSVCESVCAEIYRERCMCSPCVATIICLLIWHAAKHLLDSLWFCSVSRRRHMRKHVALKTPVLGSSALPSPGGYPDWGFYFFLIKVDAVLTTLIRHLCFRLWNIGVCQPREIKLCCISHCVLVRSFFLSLVSLQRCMHSINKVVTSDIWPGQGRLW